MKIVNICMNAPFTEYYTYQDYMLSDYQKRLGHDVTVITGTKTRNDKGQIVETVPCDTYMHNNVRLIRITTKGCASCVKHLLGIYADLPKLLNELQPDLIMVHGLGSSVVNIAVKYKAKNTHVHVIADNHQDYMTSGTKNPVLNAITAYFRFRWKRWIQYVDKVYGVTSWRIRFAREQYGISDEKLDVLVMGIDDDEINLTQDNVNRKTIRDAYGIPEDVFVFVSGGKLDKHKDILQMMNAFHQLKGEKLCYLLFGSVSYDISDEFHLLIEKETRIKYIGYVLSSDTNKLLAASDFCMFAGRHSVLWEQAVGCGVPGLFKKYEEHDHFEVGGNCIKVDNADPETLKGIMEKVVNDKAYYQALWQAAQAGAHHFAYSEIAKKSLECAEGG